MDSDDRPSNPRNSNSQPETDLEQQDDPQAALLARIAVVAERLKSKARALLAGFREPSPKTLATYYRLYIRIRHDRTLNAFASSKHSYYQARAAFVCCCMIELRAAIAKFETAMATEDWAGAREHARLAGSLIEDLRRYRPDRERERRHQADYFGEYRQLADYRPRTKPTSKRRGLASLPPDWGSRVVKAAQDANSKYALAIGVLTITGCRPAELERGVLAKCAADGAVIFRIHGAKVKPGAQGQEWRELVVPDDGTQNFRFVREAIKAAEAGGTLAAGWIEVRADSARGLGWAVGYYG